MLIEHGECVSNIELLLTAEVFRSSFKFFKFLVCKKKYGLIIYGKIIQITLQLKFNSGHRMIYVQELIS